MAKKVKRFGYVRDNDCNKAEQARLSLIHAGLELFGEYGFKATTTRMLANHAGVNISAIAYYFESKEGLYQEVIKFMIATSEKYFEEFESKFLKLILEDKLDKNSAIAGIKSFVSSMVNFFIRSEDAVVMVSIMTREQVNPSAVFEYMYENKIKHMYEIGVALVSAYIGKSVKDKEVKILAHTTYGQVISFLVARENVYRLLNVKKFDEDTIKLIEEILVNNIEACLKSRLKK